MNETRPTTIHYIVRYADGSAIDDAFGDAGQSTSSFGDALLLAADHQQNGSDVAIYEIADDGSESLAAWRDNA